MVGSEFSTRTEFTQDEHGYEGITFDVASVSLEEVFALQLKDTSAEKSN